METRIQVVRERFFKANKIAVIAKIHQKPKTTLKSNNSILLEYKIVVIEANANVARFNKDNLFFILKCYIREDGIQFR